MEVIEMDTYKKAQQLANAAATLHGNSSSPLKWYELLSDIDNPNYDWNWETVDINKI